MVYNCIAKPFNASWGHGHGFWSHDW